MNKKLMFGIYFLALFLLVLAGLMFGWFIGVDNYINSAMAGVQKGLLTTFAKGLDIIFDTTVMIPVSIFLAVLLFVAGKKKTALIFGGIMIADGALIYIFKSLIERVRPINALVSANDSAFPSGHTTTAVVFFGLLSYLLISRIKNRSLKILLNWICVLMVIFIAFSRLYLNVHWFSDVLAGLFLGLGVLFFGLGIGKKVFKNQSNNLKTLSS